LHRFLGLYDVALSAFLDFLASFFWGCTRAVGCILPPLHTPHPHSLALIVSLCFSFTG